MSEILLYVLTFSPVILLFIIGFDVGRILMRKKKPIKNKETKWETSYHIW